MTLIGRYEGRGRGTYTEQRNVSDPLQLKETFLERGPTESFSGVSSGSDEPKNMWAGRVDPEKVLDLRGRMLSAGIDHEAMRKDQES